MTTDRRSMRVQAARKRLGLAYLAAAQSGDVAAVDVLKGRFAALGTDSRPGWARRAPVVKATSSPGPLASALDSCMNRIAARIRAAN